MKVEDQQDLQDYDYYEGYYDGTDDNNNDYVNDGADGIF